MTAFEWLCFAAAGLLYFKISWWAALAVLPAVAFLTFFHMPFIDCERFARARRRRSECVACGCKLPDVTAVHCFECGYAS
jgi:hypothetical protein